MRLLKKTKEYAYQETSDYIDQKGPHREGAVKHSRALFADQESAASAYKSSGTGYQH